MLILQTIYPLNGHCAVKDMKVLLGSVRWSVVEQSREAAGKKASDEEADADRDRDGEVGGLGEVAERAGRDADGRDRADQKDQQEVSPHVSIV